MLVSGAMPSLRDLLAQEQPALDVDDGLLAGSTTKR